MRGLTGRSVRQATVGCSATPASHGRRKHPDVLFWEESTPMRQIIAIVRPFVAERVLESLRNAPVEAFTVCEVKGFGRQKHYLEEYRGGDYAFAFLPKVEITLWVDDLRAEEVMRLVVQQARSGRMGDGKVFVVAAETAVIDLAGPRGRTTGEADAAPPDSSQDV